jgi:hypothetical protein
MIIADRGQPPKLIYPVILSQLVGTPPARSIIGLAIMAGITHALILRPVFSRKSSSTSHQAHGLAL